VVLLACTELSFLADRMPSDARPPALMDASDIVARAAVTFALTGQLPAS
jgi:aspartate/glutamate racemase